MMYGSALIEHLVLLDQHRNYQSFCEAQQEAEDGLDRVIMESLQDNFFSGGAHEILAGRSETCQACCDHQIRERHVKESVFGCRHVKKWHERANLVVRAANV